MKARRSLQAICILALGLSIGTPAARAGDWNQATLVTFTQPVEIPGHVLQAGSYLFVLAENDFNRQIVQVLSPDRSTAYATVETVAAERLQPADATILTLAERSSNQPEAVLTWFYAGEATGHEFIYPRSEEKKLAMSARETLAAVPNNGVGFK